MSVSACWHYCESDLGGWQMEGHRLKASERTCSQVGGSCFTRLLMTRFHKYGFKVASFLARTLDLCPFNCIWCIQNNVNV